MQFCCLSSRNQGQHDHLNQADACCHAVSVSSATDVDGSMCTQVSEVSSLIGDAWKREAARAITAVSRMSSARPFLEPVSEEEVPDYPLIIKNPMDLGTVRERIRSGTYATPGHAWQDVQLVSLPAE